MLSGDVKYKKLYYELLYRTEEAKKELSVAETTYIDIQSDEFNIYEEVKLDAEIFNAIIDKKIDETIELIQDLLKDNFLKIDAIERIILVGGTTLIPYLRKKLAEAFQITIDNSIDPSTAIVIGAAYFAGNKISGLDEAKPVLENKEVNKIQDIKIIYEKTTNDNEELFYFESSSKDELQFRIIRKDGGYDSGLKKFTKSFNEFINIKEKVSNHFTLQIFDLNQNCIYTNSDIQIVNGLYNVSGQPLPNDICIELDSRKGDTYLDVIFKKNLILPVSKTIYKTISKNILKINDDKLTINIVEGKSGSMPGSNLSIGFIELKSSDLKDDLIKGTDVEITITISESRDISVEVYMSSIDQEIKEVFNPSTRNVSLEKMKNELNLLIKKIDNEIENELEVENLDILQKLKTIRDTCFDLLIEIETISTDVTTDIKYKIDEAKRQLMVKFDDMTRNRNLNLAIVEYEDTKSYLEEEIQHYSEKYQAEFKRLIQNDKEIINSGNIEYIERKTKELDKFSNTIYFSKNENYANQYYFYRTLDMKFYRDEKQANKMFELGDKAMENERYNDFKAIINGLYSILTDEARKLHFRNDDPIFDNTNSTGLN